ncbi:hypothetical protein Q7P37_011002 [Cladosporium fusiforme]
MRFPLFHPAALLAAVCSSLVTAQDNDTSPVSIFKTRPHARAPALNVTIQDGFSHGYIFIAPYNDALGSAPYIYDKLGNLVWDGYGAVGAATAHNFHVCSYQGADHLCMMVGNQQEGYAFGTGIIVDSDYRIVASVQTGDSVPPVDMHEFTLADDGETALVTSYNIVPVDLSYPPYDVTAQQGWLNEGVFQEINVTTGQVLFEWYSSNHVNITDTRILPHTPKAGNDGFTPRTPFDYFHINSVAKSTNTGDYLISARHVSTIYSINATDRNIIWRLSCPGTDASQPSDFECQNGLNFSSQHDARFISENDTHTVISIFDDASNGFNKTAPQSSGMVISLDHNDNTATLISQTFAPPEGGILSDSQGNSQHLPDNHVFHGWGSIGAISEHAPDSNGDMQPVLYATFADVTRPGSVMNYRAFSFEWQSTPSTTKPAVYSYARNTSSPNAIYVSWNGATTVATWNFYAADEIGQDFVAIGSSAKQGFETVFRAEAFHRWVMVEAVGSDGASLRNSSFQPAFVPSEGLVGACDEVECVVSMRGFEETEG